MLLHVAGMVGMLTMADWEYKVKCALIEAPQGQYPARKRRT